MIYFYASERDVAKNVTRGYGMKRLMDIKRFEVYRGDGALMVVGGEGAVKCAAALAFLCAVFSPCEGDVFVNIGVTREFGAQEIVSGGVSVCNKITDMTDGRDYYPDMLYKHDFSECALVSAATAMPSDSSAFTDGVSCEGFVLHDCEGAFVYQTACFFFSGERIFMFRIARGLECAAGTQKIFKWLDSIMTNIAAERTKSTGLAGEIGGSFTNEEEVAISALTANLRLTVAMKAELTRFLKAAKLQGVDVSAALSDWADVITNDKTEGKRLYGKLKDDLRKTVFAYLR